MLRRVILFAGKLITRWQIFRCVFLSWASPPPDCRKFERAAFGGWTLAAVGTFQSGDAITIIYTNSDNVFGISQDRAQLSGLCVTGLIVTSGSVQSKLNNYF